MNRIPGPLPYHREIVEHLRATEPGLWDWFASTRRRAEGAESVRLDLLKTTYRLEPVSQPHLYTAVERVRDEMRATCTVTLYQAQSGSNLNAALVFLPGEAHIVLSGPVASVLTETELRAVLAHEMAHFVLFEANDGEYLVAADLLRALANDPAAGVPASESLRLFSLWTEIFADRWACHLTGDATATVAALLKTETGLAEVDAASYLRQADEVFTKDGTPAEQHSHPELYLRARALRLWTEQGDDAQTEIDRMIAGGLHLRRLDLLGQKRAARITRAFLHEHLQPDWYRTEAVLAHARQFFPEFTTEQVDGDEAELKLELKRGDDSFRDYVCFLLLDFATVDRDLGDVALAAAIVRAGQLGLEDRFAELARQELGLGKKAFAKAAANAAALLEATAAGGSR